MKNLTIEVNPKFIPSVDTYTNGKAIVMVTPDIGEDYWLVRVKVHKEQSIIAFPKFGTIGISFAKETDWNTNLPYSVPADRLYAHIRRNKGFKSIKKADCIAAIETIQDFLIKNKGNRLI